MATDGLEVASWTRPCRPATIFWVWSAATVYHSLGGGRPASRGGAPSCGASDRRGRGVAASVCGRRHRPTSRLGPSCDPRGFLRTQHEEIYSYKDV